MAARPRRDLRGPRRADAARRIRRGPRSLLGSRLALYSVGQGREMLVTARSAAGAVLAIALMLGAVVVGAQPAKRAQRVGVLDGGFSVGGPTLKGFKAGLKAEGLVEGQDFLLDIRLTRGVKSHRRSSPPISRMGIPMSSSRPARPRRGRPRWRLRVSRSCSRRSMTRSRRASWPRWLARVDA